MTPKVLMTVAGSLLAAAVMAGCAVSPAVIAPRSPYLQPAAKTRVLTLTRPNGVQASKLTQLGKYEHRPVVLKRDAFGHPVIGPELTAAEKALLKALDADRRSVRESGTKGLPAGLMSRATKHFQFFQPNARVAPRIVPLFQANGRDLLGFRAEVEVPRANPDEAPDLYFAYYDRQGRLLAANG